MVAAVGNAVLRALLMTQGLVNPVIHRDLSPANIMFRTTSRTLEQQIADCSFDPCLIDMGSATMALGDDTITRRADIWRFATPAYAAPEMLTQDIEGIAALRRSPAIDVYALSSILYQLYSGRKPFDFESTDAAATGSFYLVKTKTKPALLELRCEGDEALVQIIMKGLSVEQCDRPTEQQMLEVLSAYLTDAESEGREGAGDEAAIDIDSGTYLKVDVAGERAREILNQARHDAMTRRRFIIGGAIAAVAGLSVIGAATHGFGIPDYLDGIRGSLGDYTGISCRRFRSRLRPPRPVARHARLPSVTTCSTLMGISPIRAPSVSRSPTGWRSARSLWASVTMSFWTVRARPG